MHVTKFLLVMAYVVVSLVATSFRSSPSVIQSPVYEANAQKPNYQSHCTNRSSFVADVTIPDGSQIEPGQTFTKVWRIRNSGTCTWTTSYSFGHYSFGRFGAPAKVKLTRSVAPGATVDISVRFTAPDEGGSYRSTWQLETPGGVNFGIRPYVQFEVADSLGTLKEELYFASVGGTGDECGPTVSGPDFESQQNHVLDYILLTFRDVVLDDAMQVGVRMPGGSMLSRTFRLSKSMNCDSVRTRHDYTASGAGWMTGFEQASGSILQVMLYVPAGAPVGQWTITVTGDGRPISRNFMVRASPEPDMIVTLTGRQYDPYVQINCEGVRKGQTLRILGESFPANQSFPIGVYRDPHVWTDPSILVTSIDVRSNAQGRFSTTMIIGREMAIGTYHLLVPASSIYSGSRQAERYSPGISSDFCFEVK